MRIEDCKDEMGSKIPQMDIEEEEKIGMEPSMVVHESESGQSGREKGNKKIFERAIASAQKHNIKLKPGRKNSGGGDCSYLSVIYNINERGCFNNKS